MGDDAVTTLALSGADNTGKTKQLGILTRRIGPAAASSGPLDAHDARWEAIKKNGKSRWWFETGTMQEVAEVLAASYLQRSHQSGARTAGVRLMDRGMPMLEASVAATAAVRENLTPEQAANRARDLLEPYARDLKDAEAGEHGIVLLHHEDPAIGTARALSHETSVTPTYADYQVHLHHQIHRLVGESRFDSVIVVKDRSVVAVQHDLRRLLHPHTAPVPAGCLSGVRVVALGGMSEASSASPGPWPGNLAPTASA